MSAHRRRPEGASRRRPHRPPRPAPAAHRDITGGPTPPLDPILVDAAISPNGRTLTSTMWLTTRDQDPVLGEPTGTDLAPPSGTPASAALTARPTERCDVRSAPNARYDDPSWSPDRHRLVWGERDGIWTTPVAPGAGDCGLAPRRLIAGGSQPDRGRANVPRRRR